MRKTSCDIVCSRLLIPQPCMGSMDNAFRMSTLKVPCMTSSVSVNFGYSCRCKSGILGASTLLRQCVPLHMLGALAPLSMPVSRLIRAFALAALAASPAAAQSIDDGVLLPTKVLSTGLMYSHDSWTEYWEGALKRTNGNIGAVTTQSAMVTTGYGVTSRLTVLAMLPYVWTHASAGTLEGMKGIQDATIAAK